MEPGACVCQPCYCSRPCTSHTTGTLAQAIGPTGPRLLKAVAAKSIMPSGIVRAYPEQLKADEGAAIIEESLQVHQCAQLG